MRQTIITLSMLLCFLAVSKSQPMSAQTKAKPRVIKNPEVEYNPYWFEFSEIELTKDATIIRGNLHHQPHCWVRIDDHNYLVDRHTGKEYKILRAEGIQLNEQMWMPDSGRMPCTLYFEPLDADVTELNLLDKAPDSRAENRHYGIKLHSKAKPNKKNKVTEPKMLTSEYYMSQAFTPDTEWHLDNNRYKDPEAVVWQSGKAQLVVHFDPLPEELVSSFGTQTVRVQNQFTRGQNNVNAPFDPDSKSWTFNLDLPHPQWVYLPNFGNIFIQPGDTLDVYTTNLTNEYFKPLYKSFRGNSESAMINALAEGLIDKFRKKEFNYDEIEKACNEGPESVMKYITRWTGQTTDIIENEELHQTLINTPLSTFGKDMVMMNTIIKKVVEVEDAVFHYLDKQIIAEKREDGTTLYIEDPDFVPLNYDDVYSPLKKYKELIYDNPLALCDEDQWVFINRSLFGGVFKGADMDGTFINDLRIAQTLDDEISFVQKMFLTESGTEEMDSMLNNVADTIASQIIEIRSPKVASAVINDYRKFVRATEGKAEREDSKWTEEQHALWNRLFGNYQGNMLYIDFWGLGCGPCRQGMIGMRKRVEELKDEHYKFIYVASTADTPREKGEQWMEENNIKGEHIFVSKSEWAMLTAMLNFTGIPHAALCGPDGKLIQNNFELYSYNIEGLKKLRNQYIKE